MPQQLNRIQGYSLIELLAAIVMTAIGILGILQVQIASTRADHDLLMWIHANLLANDIARKIDAMDNSVSVGTNFSEPPMILINCHQTDCSDTQLAGYYIAHWKCRLGRWTQMNVCQQMRLSGILLEGDGQITSLGTKFVITIQWLDSQQEQQFLTHYHARIS